jgi:hypothetical protein
MAAISLVNLLIFASSDRVPFILFMLSLKEIFHNHTRPRATSGP